MMQRHTPVTGHEDPPGTAPWAMQIAVHAPKTDPAHTTAVCEAAALAALLVIADPRSEPGGEWHNATTRWLAGRIRKVVRRARGARWDTAAQLGNGVTVTHRGAEVRAYVPGPTDTVDPALSKLQVAGLALPHDPTYDTVEATPGMVTVAVNPHLGLDAHPGKAAAQCAHAAQLTAMTMSAERLEQWRGDRWSLRVIWPDGRHWDDLVASAPVVITDAGFTVVAPGSQTAAATWD